MRIALAALSFRHSRSVHSPGLAQEGDAEAGATVFKKCATCHVIDKDQNKVGSFAARRHRRTAGTPCGLQIFASHDRCGQGWSRLGRTRRSPNIA